jgi:hypothetical protein
MLTLRLGNSLVNGQPHSGITVLMPDTSLALVTREPDSSVRIGIRIQDRNRGIGAWFSAGTKDSSLPQRAPVQWAQSGRGLEMSSFVYWRGPVFVGLYLHAVFFVVGCRLMSTMILSYSDLHDSAMRLTTGFWFPNFPEISLFSMVLR